MLALLVVGMLAGSPVHVVGPEDIQEALNRPQETLTLITDHKGLTWWHRGALVALLAGDGLTTGRALKDGRPEAGLWARPLGTDPSSITVWVSRVVVAGACLTTAEILAAKGHGKEVRDVGTASIVLLALVVISNGT